MSNKNISLGKDNFKELIEDNNYYVDKTLLIKKLIDLDAKVTLITRPRRFGKTLNMSMLKYFFEKTEKNHKYLFNNLKISKSDNSQYLKEQGRYPVIYLTLKNAKKRTWEETFKKLKSTISNEYKRHKYLLNSNCLSKLEKEEYNNIIAHKGEVGDYTSVLFNLSNYLKRYFNEKVIILIDEYDTPIQSGYLNGYYEEILDFMKSFLIEGFKDNEALKRGVLTGIMKVAKESIFSDFNNPVISTVLSHTFKTDFGFTQEEVTKILKDFNLENKLDNLKTWYNGYLFGDKVIYNPWSILNYVLVPEQGFKSYWLNTSENAIIKEVLRLNQSEGKKIIEKLLEGKKVSKNLSENIVYQNIKKDYNSAWSFLLHSGYLKATNMRREYRERIFDISIPNEEVSEMYINLLKNYFEDDIKLSLEIETLINSLLEEKLNKFSRILKNIYLSHVSYYDLSKLNNFDKIREVQQDTRFENFHHGFILGLLMYGIKYYEIYSNREYGNGRPDIVLVPKKKDESGYIFEFKWSSTQSERSLETLVKEAKAQIKDKKYIEGVKKIHNFDKVINVAVGFKGKNLKIDIFK